MGSSSGGVSRSRRFSLKGISAEAVSYEWARRSCSSSSRSNTSTMVPREGFPDVEGFEVGDVVDILYPVGVEKLVFAF